MHFDFFVKLLMSNSEKGFCVAI